MEPGACFWLYAFLLFYVVATFFYPGGSQLDKTASGFSWTQNYWCNLSTFASLI